MTTVDSFLMGGGASAKFPSIGTKISGEVLAAELQQQTDFDTNEPLVWPDGNPRMQVIVTLQTEEEDEEGDDGLRRLFVKGQMQRAVGDAVRKAGARGLEVGGVLTVQYYADGEQKKKGMSAQKLYRAKYQRATVKVPEEDWDKVEDDAGDDEPF